jgi:hypothetical protein
MFSNTVQQTKGRADPYRHALSQGMPVGIFMYAWRRHASVILHNRLHTCLQGTLVLSVSSDILLSTGVAYKSCSTGVAQEASSSCSSRQTVLSIGVGIIKLSAKPALDVS